MTSQAPSIGYGVNVGRLRRVLSGIAITFAVSACAFDDTGVLAAHVTQGDGATVFDIFSVGAYLRTRSDDAGIFIGVARNSYVFDQRKVGDVGAGWYVGLVPLPASPAVGIDSRRMGFGLAIGNPMAGLTIGYAAQTVLARVPATSTLAFRLSYSPEHPETTYLRMTEDEIVVWRY